LHIQFYIQDGTSWGVGFQPAYSSGVKPRLKHRQDACAPNTPCW